MFLALNPVRSPLKLLTAPENKVCPFVTTILEIPLELRQVNVPADALMLVMVQLIDVTPPGVAVGRAVS